MTTSEHSLPPQGVSATGARDHWPDSLTHSLTRANASQTPQGMQHVLNKYFYKHIKKPQMRQGKNAKLDKHRKNQLQKEKGNRMK